jgi:NAD(P)-dependent dehydrogenase (short-subunit alcohol dehydrogenase family)
LNVGCEKLDEATGGTLASIGDDGRYRNTHERRENDQIGAMLRHFGSLPSVQSMNHNVLLKTAGYGKYTASKFALVGMMEALRAELDGTNLGVSVFCPGLVNTNIGSSNRNRPANLADAGFKPDPKMIAQMQAAMKDMKGPPPGMDALEAGQRVLNGVRNHDLYILTTPEFEAEFQARGEAIVASLPDDVNAPPARVTMGRMILGK